MRLGKYDEAIKHFEEFDSDDMFLSSEAIGCIGDAYMEKGQTEEAIKYYIKAANNNSNNFTSPFFLMKAAFAYEDIKNYEKALEIYENIKKDYFKSSEAREVDKYISRVKELLGKDN